MDRIIIGLTGPGAGGKGEVSKVLQERGFVYFSLSDEIRKEARKRKWSDTKREVLQDLGDELRSNLGNDVLAKRVATLPEFKHADMVVIDSIRHPAEIEYLKEVFDAKIIGVTASPEKLFDRMRQRNREGDPKTFEEFEKMLKREMGIEGSSVMQVHKCLAAADFVISNEGDKPDLRKETEKALHELGIESGISGERDHHHHHGH